MIACYVRVSTAEQKEHGYSIDEQIERLKNFCAALGYKSPKVYNDAGYSGAKIDRPALQSLIHDVKSHKIEKVLVYKLDRLSRSQKDTLMLIEDIFISNGCDFVSISENFDTSTPLGRAMIGILAVFAQLEREQIKERMNMGREARAKQGKYAGSWRHPIGYDYIDGKLVVNEFEKLQIQKIFEDYVSGKGLQKIADELNESGMTHKYGKWFDTTIRNLMQRKTYIGYVAFNGEWYKGDHEPIISEELFNKAQRLRQKKRTDYEERHISYGLAVSYLGGMIHCKQCGEKYYKFARSSQKKGGKKYTYAFYSCKNRYPRTKATGTECKNTNYHMEELDQIVFDEIRKLSFEGTPKRPRKPDKTPIIVSKINELDKQLDRLLALYTVGDVPLDKLQKNISKINEQKNNLEAELTAIKNEQEEKEDYKAIVNSFDYVLEHGTLEDVRAVIKTLIDHIEIDGEDITIYWNFN